MTEWIRRRRSIRKYTGQPLSEGQIRELLEAAMAAPSASNRQPWEFVIVQDRRGRERLAATHPWSRMCAKAGAVFVVCGYPERSRHWVEDCSAATENLLLAATSLGLGAVWVAVYPDEQAERFVRGELGIPSEVRVLCLVPVGYPAEEKPPHTKYDPARVHYERW
ncbi:MAG: nitroreductase family protein [Chloroflexia bacterium]